jgi:17 kDa outer membrane surface antigen
LQSGVACLLLQIEQSSPYEVQTASSMHEFSDRVVHATIIRSSIRWHAMRAHNAVISFTCALLATSVANDALGAGAAFLHNTAIAALSDEDRQLQRDTAISVLESEDPKLSKTWDNPKTRSSGRSDSLGNYKSDDGLHCRKLRLFTHAKGIDSQLEFPVCKNPGGEWFIASGKKLSKA